jgi:hypothetical protein
MVKSPDVQKTAQAEVTQPESERPERVVVLPEAAEPRRWAPTVALIAALLAGLLVAGSAVYAWQRAEVADREEQIGRAQAAVRDADVAAVVAGERIATLEGRIRGLEEQLTSLRAGRTVLRGSRIELRREIERLRAQVADARRGVRAEVGQRLHAGTHIGFVVAVNAPDGRVLFDPARWFSGSPATHAAIQDGKLLAGGTLKHPRYVRNSDTSWRLVPISSTAIVTLRGYAGAVAPTQVTVARLGEIHASSAGIDERVTRDPFWAVVRGGQIVELTQQRYP